VAGAHGETEVRQQLFSHQHLLANEGKRVPKDCGRESKAGTIPQLLQQWSQFGDQSQLSGDDQDAYRTHHWNSE
jgi:hypothetical protein